MKIRRIILAATTSLALLLAACSSGGTSTEDGAAPAENTATETVKIGFSQVTMQSPFYVELQKGAEAAAEAMGAELLFVDANGDVEKQNNDIQDLITQGVKVLILNPVNPEAVAPSLEAAKAAGIPVITVDRPVTSGAVAHIGRDNKAMGKLVGQALAKALGADGGKIIALQGDAGGVVMADRRDGFADGIKDNAKATIVLGPYAEYVRANAVTAMQDLLQSNPDVKAVYAHNDDMALGALQVLQEAGRNDVLVCGVDGLGEALTAIANGDQYIATAFNDPRYLGDVTIQVAMALIAGKTVPAFVDAGTQLADKSNAAGAVSDALFAEYRPTLNFG